MNYFVCHLPIDMIFETGFIERKKKAREKRPLTGT